MTWICFDKFEIDINENGKSNFINSTSLASLKDVEQLKSFYNDHDPRYSIFFAKEIFKAKKELQFRLAAVLLVFRKLNRFLASDGLEQETAEAIAKQFCSLFAYILENENSPLILTQAREMLDMIHDKYSKIALAVLVPKR